MINDYIIDYSLVNEFDIEALKKGLCLPLFDEGLYRYVAFSSLSDDTILESDLMLVKKIDSSKEEILFYLSDFETRLNLYLLVKQCYINNEVNQIYMNRFVELLLGFALQKRSSDIHIETTKDGLVVRFRIDGKLKQFFKFDKRLYLMLSSVIKLKCALDITQKRKPLDGRFSLILDEKNIDFRISTMPTLCGESIVLRVLEAVNDKYSLTQLGFNQAQLTTIENTLFQSHGLVLITGPTGSGKTTTLYSMLKSMDAQSKKIVTIEDPIEYELKNIQQIAVNQELEVSFEVLLKNILRQDPDVIMIGEIRDKVSLQIALQASLTGHLVLSTLHTNDSIETLSRLFDLEAKHYIVAATLKTIIAQRLVLKKCDCIEGCSDCNYTKFNGRVSLSEIFSVNSDIASMINKQRSTKEIFDYVKANGFISIYEDAQNKIKKGITTKEEVYSVLGLKI